jgi:hypothetical protein
MPECRFCSAAVPDSAAVVLWDGQPYCPSCIRAVCPEVPAAPEETLAPDGLRLRYWLLHPGGAFAALFFLAPGVFVLTLGDPKIRGGGWCCLGFLAAVWLAVMGAWSLAYYASPRSRLPRTVKVRGGELVVAYRDSEGAAPLAECAWHPGTTRWDYDTFCRPRTPAVVISCPGRKPVACGLSPESYRRWVEFLTRAGVRARGRFPWARLLAWCPLGLVAGVAAGGASEASWRPRPGTGGGSAR